MSDDGVTGATATTVFDPGVVADGVTDNGPRIQAAINSATAAGGGVVPLPSGMVITKQPIWVKTGVRLSGQGKTLTTLKAGSGFTNVYGPDGGHPLITTSGASNVTVSDLNANQNQSAFSTNISQRLNAYLVDVRGSHNVLVTRLSVRNPFTYSIAAVNSNLFLISNCDVRAATSGRWDQLDGIHVLESFNGFIRHNYVDQRFNGTTDGDDGIAMHTIGTGTVHDITIADNVVRGGDNGSCFKIATGDGDIYNITIQNNEFYGGPHGVKSNWYGSANFHDVTIDSNVFHDLKQAVKYPETGYSIRIIDSTNNSASKPYNVHTTANNSAGAPGFAISATATGAGNVTSGNVVS